MLKTTDDMMLCVDPGDVALVDGAEGINERGLVKICAATMFHGPTPPGRAAAEVALTRVLDAAARLGYCKRDVFLSAFAISKIPSRSARDMANEVADLLGNGGVFKAMSSPP